MKQSNVLYIAIGLIAINMVHLFLPDITFKWRYFPNETTYKWFWYDMGRTLTIFVLSICWYKTVLKERRLMKASVLLFTLDSAKGVVDQLLFNNQYEYMSFFVQCGLLIVALLICVLLF